jgi:predicted phage replisome organizer
MSDNRKYYYLKLKENYFDDDSIVLLESMQDGVLYSNILLKLYLKSLKHGGRLQLDEDIPYTAQMIATITRQQIGTVERALQIFLKLGLVEVLDSGTFYMSNIELLIGQSSTEAERKRAARLQNKALSAPRTSGGHLSDIRPPEIEIELEKEIEIEKEREGETGHPAPAAYGRYNNVILTDTELSGLKQSCPTSGSIILTGFPAISLPPGNSTTAMQPPFTSGRRRTLPKARLPRNRAYPIIHARRARAYEKRN